MRLIAITGGIGSGKSVVSQIVKVMGYQVYDCDQRARALMIESEDVRRQLIEAFGKETFLDDGSLNRQHLSAKAFGNTEALARLNGIVHPATASDMLQWAKTQAGNGAKVAFMETALLRTAGLDRMVDEVWHVTAPASVRIPRVMARSGLSAQQVQDRMKSQTIEEEPAPGEHVIINDGTAAVLPQISQLLFNCKHNNN
jgi:dephospho-CoA kinase